MSKSKLSDDITVAEAVDNLSSMAELSVESLDAEEREPTLKWLRSKDKEAVVSSVRQTFKAVHNYLKKVYNRDKQSLKDVDMQKGIHAIMVLADEAAEQFDKCSALFARVHGKSGGTKALKEYQELQKFYHQKIIKRFQEVLETEEEWMKEWTGEKDVADIRGLGLKDLETVKRDKEYELFYLLDENGTPFYNKNLLRHIKLVSDFDEVAFHETGHDPLLKIRMIQDKDAHESAKSILEAHTTQVKDFYRNALKFKERQVVNHLGMALMALMLASNDRNLVYETYGKSCLQYFCDFQKYLRAALSSGDYTRLIQEGGDGDKLMQATLKLLHSLCYALFTRKNLKGEMSSFVYEVMRRAESGAQIKHVGSVLSQFDMLMEYHDAIESVLRKYPNGPLFKALDVFRDRAQFIGFDPLQQQNLPSSVYKMHSDYITADIIRMPSPTHQERIDEAYIVDEFKGFLRKLGEKKSKNTLLLFNLQDRTNWKEYARCEVIESLQTDAEFAKNLYVVSLPKNTDFYLQTNEYLKENNAGNFLKVFQAQIEGMEACGFAFPKGITQSEIVRFTSKILPLIHHHFFADKELLTRKNRLDFIEIYYHFLQLKLIELIDPGFVAFACKDAVDIGAATSGGFYGFIKMLGKDVSWSEEDRDFMLWMLYAPALFVRERPIDIRSLTRAISFMTLVAVELKENRSAILRDIEPLFERGAFISMSCKPL